jgi:hypothetical protein
MRLERLLLLLLLLFILSIGDISCSRSSLVPAPPPRVDSTGNPPAKPPTDTSSVFVYVAGDTMMHDMAYAAYWKNGLITQIPSGVNTYVSSIFVHNSDVYVTAPGTNYSSSFNYWKNGVGITLPDTLGNRPSVNSLIISAGDIYLTGTSLEYPNLNYGVVYWKNDGYGIHLVPLGITIHHSSGESIAVSNQDVYISGDLDYGAAYWLNGHAVRLPIDSEYYYNTSIAKSICISNGNVYIAGSEGLGGSGSPEYFSKAVYWLNDKLVRLTQDTGSVANAITVVGNDVYVAGAVFGSDYQPRAAYWKNGTLFTLDSNFSYANSIAVHGTDVYVAGTVSNQNARYWKNEKPFSLGFGEAYSILVVDK